MAADNLKTVAFPLLAAVGPICGQPADGARVHGMIEALLNQGYSVTLDFQDVRIVTPDFYDAVVGELDIPEPRLNTINMPVGQS